MADHGNGLFQVDPTGPAAAQLRALLLQAQERGDGSAARRAARTLYRRLQTDPRSFGEAQFRLPHLNLTLRKGVERPLVVWFAVHETEPLVFIQRFALMGLPSV
jgi:hypothetical protein